jgi:hypothetical protein
MRVVKTYLVTFRAGVPGPSSSSPLPAASPVKPVSRDTNQRGTKQGFIAGESVQQLDFTGAVPEASLWLLPSKLLIEELDSAGITGGNGENRPHWMASLTL